VGPKDNAAPPWAPDCAETKLPRTLNRIADARRSSIGPGKRFERNETKDPRKDPQAGKLKWRVEWTNIVVSWRDSPTIEDQTAKERADQVMRIWHRHRNEIAELKENLTKLD
jgi:hypothetical protein